MLEAVVVLSLLSLLAALAAPQLHRAYQAAVARGEHDRLLAQLAGLSPRAHALGVTFELTEDSLARRLPDGQPLLAVPAGWTLHVERPIRFNFVGICSGGRVRLRSPAGELSLVDLEPPACEVRSSTAARR